MDLIRKDEYKVLGITGFAEFCERYNYNIIQGLLVFYLIDKFNLSHESGVVLVGTVLSVMYLSALVGGYIADKIIGKYAAATLGAFLMLVGCSIIALIPSEHAMYLGLSVVALSIGLVKANMSSFIGVFYDKSKLPNFRRDFGFSVFYVAINLGGFVGLFLATWIRSTYGDAAPFYSNMIASLLLVINMLVGGTVLHKYIDKTLLKLAVISKLVAICVAYIALIYIILDNPVIANWAMLCAVVLCIGVLVSACKTDIKRILQACSFFGLSIIYWALYFQIFMSLEIFIDKYVRHDFLGVVVATPQFIAANSFGVMVLGSVIGHIWYKLGKRGHEVSDISKFAIAFVFMALFFCVLGGVNLVTHVGDKLLGLPIIIAYGVLFTISELSLSAVGLSLMTKIAPEGFVSRYLAIWMVTLGLGGKLGGILSSYVIINDNIDASRVNMGHGFMAFITIALCASVVCIALRKFLK